MVKFELEEFHRAIPDGDLLADMRRIATVTNQNSLTVRSYKANGGKFSGSTIISRFGGWNTALAHAGIGISTRRNIPVDELLLNIETVWRHLGRQPRHQEMRAPLSKFSKATYNERFGSWRKALETFIGYINNGEKAGESLAEADGVASSASIEQQTRSRHVNWRTRFLVMRRDDFKCQYCGRSPANNPGLELHIDHVQAFSKDGPTMMDNLKTACNVCNIGKSDLEATSN
jgi:hypothetical protein